MEIIEAIVSECERLGSNLGFGAFEGGVIYFSVFSLLIFKMIDSVKNIVDKRKGNKTKVKDKSDDVVFKIKVIK